jgi:pimeloyl-ACP methyl ester carboxylesterase
MVEKMILMAPGLNGYFDHHEADSLSFTWFQQMRKYLDEKDTTNAALAFTKTWAVGPYRTLDMNDPTTKYVAATTRNTLKTHKFSGWPVFQENPKAYSSLSTISVPVLVINSDKDLPAIDETSVYLEKTIPGARRVLIKDAAHMLNMEKPEEVNHYIENFILHGYRK